MKKLILLLLLTPPFLAKAQLEAYGRYAAHGRVEPNINYFASKKITEKIAVTFFGLVEQKWSEALIGVTWSPSPLLSIGASAGIEQGTHSPRYGISGRTQKKKMVIAVLGELGSGRRNYLYKANWFYNYSQRFTLGVTAWRLHGEGPNFRYTIPKISSTIWVMPAYDLEFNTTRLIIGVTAKM